ncbi:MAG: helix-turn-helix domain-containing protein [Microbacteriaceae bacterium]
MPVRAVHVDASPAPPRVEVRARVLAAAAELFAERGIHASSLDDIAQRAGFTKGAVYSNFTSKGHLVASLLDEQVDEQLRDAAERITPTLSFAEMLAAVRETIGATTEHRRRMFALSSEFRLYAHRHPELLPAFLRSREAARTAVHDMMADWLAAHPEVELPMPLELLTTIVLAIVMGMAFDDDVLGGADAGAALATLFGVLAPQAAEAPARGYGLPSPR